MDSPPAVVPQAQQYILCTALNTILYGQDEPNTRQTALLVRRV